MGTVLAVTLDGVDARRAEIACDAAFAEAARVERLLSVFDPASELSRVNRDAASGPVWIDAELAKLIEQARRYAHLSAGAVDATVSPLTALWRSRDDRHGGPSHPPSREEIARASASIGFHGVRLDARNGAVTYGSPGVRLEFGAMGKGYAVDRVVRTLADSGVSSALVDFGSTTYALGRPSGETSWRVGIRHPREANRIVSVARLVDRAVSTSGDDQQGIFIDGVRYGHIIDPRTGRPADAAVAASVIAPTALEADALSTAAFVLGPRRGAELLGMVGLDGVVTSASIGGRLTMTETPGWNAVSARTLDAHAPTRRRLLVGMAAAVAAFFLRPVLGHAVVYLSREEALRILMPEADGFKEEAVSLTEGQRERLASLMNGRVSETEVTWWVGEQGGRVVGYATVLNVIGKEQPITFMVAVSPEGTVRGVQVLTYRESQGSEIRSKRFLEQFAGKTLAAPLKLGRDVDGISGASLSSRSTAHAVRKALALVAVVYGISGGAS